MLFRPMLSDKTALKVSLQGCFEAHFLQFAWFHQ